MNLTKKLYTTREAAIMAGVFQANIRADINRGNLKAEKFGTNYAITREDLINYLEERKARDNGKK